MSSCTEQIVTRISDSTLYDQWKTATQNTTNGISTASVQNADTIARVKTDVEQTIRCLQEKTAQLNNVSSDIYALQQQFAVEQKNMKNASEDMKIAKERMKFLVNPEEKRTVYEGWFPMHRPLRPESMILLLAFGLFFITVFFGILMRQLGFFVNVGYILPITNMTSGSGLLSQLLNPTSLVLIAVILILAGITTYSFLR
jgi:hypothetical protein